MPNDSLLHCSQVIGEITDLFKQTTKTLDEIKQQLLLFENICE